MYIPSAFRQTGPEALGALIDQHPFATLVLTTATGPQASHLPLLIANPADPLILEGHLARKNAMADAEMDGVRVLAIFQGPQRYISSRWYPSTQQTGLGVPTWNYQVVHCHGRLELIDATADQAGRDRLYEHLQHLSRRMEHQLDDPELPPWTLADAPAEHIEQLMRGVVGIRIVVDKIEGCFKLSQNRAAADRAGAIAGLERAGTESARAMAHAMRRFDPDAD